MQAKNQACINLIGWIRAGRTICLVRLSGPGCRFRRRIRLILFLQHRSLSLPILRPEIRTYGFPEDVHPLL